MDRRSSEIGKLALKIAKLAAQIGDIPHDARNPEQGYGYTSFDAIAARLRKPLADAGVAIFLDEIGIETVRTWEAGKFARVWHCVRVTYDATIVDGETGQFVTIRCSGEGADAADKALPKAQTMAMKYLLKGLFRVSTGKDDAEADPEIDRNASGPAPEIELLSDQQRATLHALIEETRTKVEDVARYFGVRELAQLPARQYQTAVRLLERKQARRSGDNVGGRDA